VKLPANVHSADLPPFSAYHTNRTITLTRVSTAADRPARRSGAPHAKYSVSHHMVIKPFLILGLAAEYRSRRWVSSTVVRRPSDVYDTHRQTKMTAPETISRTTDMVGAHQNTFKFNALSFRQSFHGSEVLLASIFLL